MMLQQCEILKEGIPLATKLIGNRQPTESGVRQFPAPAANWSRACFVRRRDAAGKRGRVLVLLP